VWDRSIFLDLLGRHRYLWGTSEGSAITLVGLPAILIAHGERAHRLTTVGFVGVLLTIVMLNIGEGTTEAFVKPYLVTHVESLTCHLLDSTPSSGSHSSFSWSACSAWGWP
jgi:hypothetical protein